MPFCSNCGTEVDSRAAFCGNCGAKQPVSGTGSTPPPGAPYPAVDPLANISDRTACILCYIPVCGIIASVICLIAQRYRTNYRVRFHAFQSLYLFVLWLLASAIEPWPHSGFSHDVSDLIRLAVLIGWIFMLVKVSQNQDRRLPVLGDLAARSTQEQL